MLKERTKNDLTLRTVVNDIGSSGIKGVPDEF